MFVSKLETSFCDVSETSHVLVSRSFVFQVTEDIEISEIQLSAINSQTKNRFTLESNPPLFRCHFSSIISEISWGFFTRTSRKEMRTGRPNSLEVARLYQCESMNSGILNCVRTKKP